MSFTITLVDEPATEPAEEIDVTVEWTGNYRFIITRIYQRGDTEITHQMIEKIGTTPWDFIIIFQFIDEPRIQQGSLDITSPAFNHSQNPAEANGIFMCVNYDKTIVFDTIRRSKGRVSNTSGGGTD